MTISPAIDIATKIAGRDQLTLRGRKREMKLPVIRECHCAQCQEFDAMDPTEVLLRSMSVRRPRCSQCEGAGRFWVRAENIWPADGRPEPVSNPTSQRCHTCDGTGEELSVDALRARMIGQSP